MDELTDGGNVKVRMDDAQQNAVGLMLRFKDDLKEDFGRRYATNLRQTF